METTGMKTVDFSKATIVDIKGDVIETGEKIHVLIGEAIYREANSITLAELAKRIYEGKEVELRDSEVQEIKQIIEKSFIPLFKRQLIQFMGI